MLGRSKPDKRPKKHPVKFRVRNTPQVFPVAFTLVPQQMAASDVDVARADCRLLVALNLKC